MAVRLRRWLWWSLALLSAVMAVAVAVVWVDSESPAAKTWRTRREWQFGRYEIAWSFGHVNLEISYPEPPEIRQYLDRGGKLVEADSSRYRWSGPGFSWADLTGDPRPALQPHLISRFFSVRCWLAMTVFLVLPTVALVQAYLRRRRRRREGRAFEVIPRSAQK